MAFCEYGREGSLLSGFTSSHKKLTIISGGCYFRGVATFGGSLLSELYGSLEIMDST